MRFVHPENSIVFPEADRKELAEIFTINGLYASMNLDFQAGSCLLI